MGGWWLVVVMVMVMVVVVVMVFTNHKVHRWSRINLDERNEEEEVKAEGREVENSPWRRVSLTRVLLLDLWQKCNVVLRRALPHFQIRSWPEAVAGLVPRGS